VSTVSGPSGPDQPERDALTLEPWAIDGLRRLVEAAHDVTSTDARRASAALQLGRVHGRHARRLRRRAGDRMSATNLAGLVLVFALGVLLGLAVANWAWRRSVRPGQHRWPFGRT
jgi:hypothetical protein